MKACLVDFNRVLKTIEICFDMEEIQKYCFCGYSVMCMAGSTGIDNCYMYIVLAHKGLLATKAFGIQIIVLSGVLIFEPVHQ